ncbi:MAG: DUF3307 domain-containing protein [Akkermansiaceae bacterium]|nr:DUF3307 domain-containing protein [Akkermansiaceae bacterium]
MSPILDQGPWAVLFALFIGHALADFPLQGAYLAEKKGRLRAGDTTEWLVALFAHGLIHAGAVWLVTGSMMLGGIEFVLHCLIDTGKSERKYGLLVDQTLHLCCKVAYVVYWVNIPGP